MTTSESEQHLQIWKDLAISKQMIMNEAASSLKLKPEWTQEELKEALDHAIKKAKDAEVDMQRTRSEAERSVADMQKRLEAAEKARGISSEASSKADQLRQQAATQLANGRKENAEALKKAKQQLIDKDRELKAINTALADTPENVLKKLKNLKKQKLEEAQGRNKAEESLRKLKKENKQLEASVEEQKELIGKAEELAKHYRELRTFSEAQRESLVAAEKDADDLPAIDFSLLDAFEEEEEVEDKKDVKKTAAHA